MYLLTLIYFMEYTYMPHCPHSAARDTPKSANQCSNDPNHAITIPSNLTPAFVSSLADLFISFLFACWAWICCSKWEIHNPISQTNSSLVRPHWQNTMLLHDRSLLMNSKTSKVRGRTRFDHNPDVNVQIVWVRMSQWSFSRRTVCCIMLFNGFFFFFLTFL